MFSCLFSKLLSDAQGLLLSLFPIFWSSSSPSSSKPTSFMVTSNCSTDTASTASASASIDTTSASDISTSASCACSTGCCKEKDELKERVDKCEKALMDLLALMGKGNLPIERSLASAPVNFLEHEDPSDDSEEDVICGICREVIVGACSVTGCGHTFCGICLVTWFEDCQGDIEGLTCPTCRHEVSKTQRLSKARALDTMIQRWVQRRLARGPWAEFEDWTYRTSLWAIHCRAIPEFQAPMDIRDSDSE